MDGWIRTPHSGIASATLAQLGACACAAVCAETAVTSATMRRKSCIVKERMWCAEMSVVKDRRIDGKPRM